MLVMFLPLLSGEIKWLTTSAVLKVQACTLPLGGLWLWDEDRMCISVTVQFKNYSKPWQSHSLYENIGKFYVL